MTGERDLQRLVAGMEPVLDPQHYCFVSVPAGHFPSCTPLLRFTEAEGDTLIVSAETARTLGFDDSRCFHRITLTVHSDLDAVGLTAAFAQCLTHHGISANVVAGFFHDHIFVPAASADAAMAALESLSADARGE